MRGPRRSDGAHVTQSDDRARDALYQARLNALEAERDRLKDEADRQLNPMKDWPSMKRYHEAADKIDRESQAKKDALLLEWDQGRNKGR